MAGDIKVSVIVPVYNTAKYLRKCLDSVVNQTLGNIEIICVDDGSTDDSLSILNDYAANDRRIKIIKQNNLGAAVARNKAIKAARGQFLAFIDSDDWYPDLKSLEKLHGAAVSHKVKIAGGSFSEYDSNTKKIITDYTNRGHLESYQFKKAGIVEYENWQSDIGWIRFIYDRSMIIDNEVYFPILTRHEDPVFLVKAMVAAGKFYAIPDVVYCYRIFYKSMNLSQKNINDAVSGIAENLLVARNNKFEILKKWSIESLMWYATLSPEYRDLRSDRDRLAEDKKMLIERVGRQENEIYQLNDAVHQLEEEISRSRSENAAILKSGALRVGKIITYPVRLIRTILK